MPTDGPHERLFRSGILCNLMADRGWDVTWWSSTFDHAAKTHRFGNAQTLDLRPNLHLRLLHGPAYPRNVSLKRIKNHRALADAFAAQAPHLPKPDAILCSLPTLELCDEATKFGRANKVPVALDVRDQWPDLFFDLVPSPARPIARLALGSMTRQLRSACRRADAILGNGEGAVDWGVRHAGRDRRKTDLAFEMGYLRQTPDPGAQADAWKYWADHGVRPDDGKFRVCFFGAVGHTSDFETVLEGARRSPHVQWVMCGRGDMLDDFRSSCTDIPNVQFVGWVRQPEIWTLMQCSHLGLIPYKSSANFEDGITNKPIEYLSSGLPVLTTLRGGILRQLLLDWECGLFYSNGDGEGLAQLVETLAQDPMRRQAMSANALRLFESRFRAETVYAAMADHLEAISKGTPSDAATR